MTRFAARRSQALQLATLAARRNEESINMDALAFIDKAAKSKPQPVYILHGDEAFLKRQALTALDALLLEDADPEFARTVIPGAAANWSAVRSDLDTLPFLSPRRIVVIDQADPFVTLYRPVLEKYVTDPAKNGVLILDVEILAGHHQARQTSTGRGHHRLQVAATTRRQPLGDELGQEPARQEARRRRCWLAGRTGRRRNGPARSGDRQAGRLRRRPADDHAEDVDQIVGRGRAAETFKIFDAIGAGKPTEALSILNRLMEQGEAPLAVLGAFSWQLRKLAAAARFHRAGKSLPQAIADAGFQAWGRDRVEQQLRHLGRRRLDKLYEWLLEADLGMKSTGELPDRLLLERLLVRLARPRAG